MSEELQKIFIIEDLHGNRLGEAVLDNLDDAEAYAARIFGARAFKIYDSGSKKSKCCDKCGDKPC